MKKIIAPAIASLLLSHALAIPFGPTPPVNISGTVVSLLWIGETEFKYDGDLTTLAGSKDSSRYFLLLKTSSLDHDTRESFSFYAISEGIMGLSHPMMSIPQEAGQLIVFVSMPKTKAIKKGSLIEIRGYSLSGDEGGAGSKFESLTVDGKKVVLK